MKTKILKHRVPQRILIGMLLVLFCFTSKAQTWENVHFNVDWQMNVPLNSNFADKFSGWGMNFEGKYDLTPYWAIGAFLNFHTNHRYVDRRTIPLTPTASLTTDQQQSAFQLPFGISVSYKLPDNRYVKPYFESNRVPCIPKTPFTTIWYNGMNARGDSMFHPNWEWIFIRYLISVWDFM